MTKSTFKDISFLGELNWFTVHSQTDKCVEIIPTPFGEGRLSKEFFLQSSWSIFLGEGRLSKECADDRISVNFCN